MNQPIELQLPPEIYERAEQIARESNRSVENVLLEGLSLLFGSLEQVEIRPQDLPAYNDEQLWAIVYRKLAWPYENRLHELNALGKSGQLDDETRAELESLIRLIDRLTLLRSHALVLLKQRGHDIEARLNMGA